MTRDEIRNDILKLNAKSILGVLSINIQKGDLIELSFSEENKKEIAMVVNEFKN